MPAVPGFLPHRNAPLFHNGPWDPVVDFEIALPPPLPPVQANLTQAGLCGGMAFLTRDIFEASTEQLRNTDSTAIPAQLAVYLRDRLVQSFDGGPVISRWIAATATPNHDTTVFGPGLYRQTVDECAAITQDVDDGILSPIGLVLVQSALPIDVFKGHVVLVWRYERIGELLTLYTYDCNGPGLDDIGITLDVSAPAPAKDIVTNGTSSPPPGKGTIRGFFRLPYSFADPGPAYIDQAQILVHKPPPLMMKPGEKTMVTLEVINRGSTSWAPGEGYRIGSQAPADNNHWGLSRVDVPSTDPGEGHLLHFTVTAPVHPGTYAFSWQALRETVRWFSRATPAIRIAVGLPQRVRVPDVEGWRRDSALQAISTAGLKARVTGTNNGNTYVVAQDPDPLSLVDPGSEVEIQLRSGWPP